MEQFDLYLKAREEINQIDRDMASLTARKADLEEFCAIGQQLFVDWELQGTTQASAQRMAPRDREIVVEGQGEELLAALKAGAEKFKATKNQTAHIAEGVIAYFGNMSVDDLAKIIEMSGHVIGGKDPRQTLSVILCRDERFNNSRRDGWYLASPGRLVE